MDVSSVSLIPFVFLEGFLNQAINESSTSFLTDEKMHKSSPKGALQQRLPASTLLNQVLRRRRADVHSLQGQVWASSRLGEQSREPQGIDSQARLSFFFIIVKDYSLIFKNGCKFL